MRRVHSILLTSALLSVITLPAVAVADDSATVSSATYGFRTTANDKDYDSQTGVEIICNGHNVAQDFAHSADRNSDHWNNNSDNGPWPLNFSDKTVTKGELRNCAYRVSLTANGNDEWVGNGKLSISFSDGTTWTWQFNGFDLNSRGSHTESRTFDMTQPSGPGA